jgi:magnesium transporter
LTISAYVIGKHSVKQVNISEPLSVRKEMREHPEESLWIHADDRGEIFRLQENMYQRVINLREAYNSSLNANLNEIIRTLTVIATIILPLTLITGIYGMNFDVMPELHSPLGYYYSLLLIGAVAGGMVIYFKNKKWI